MCSAVSAGCSILGTFKGYGFDRIAPVSFGFLFPASIAKRVGAFRKKGIPKLIVYSLAHCFLSARQSLADANSREKGEAYCGF